MDFARNRPPHSACWAVQRFVRELGEEISEGLLFGLGRTAWYCFPQTPRAALITYHPLRVHRMFQALNVPTEVYRCWTGAALTHHALSGCDGNTLLEVAPTIFHAAEKCDEDAWRHYCVWSSRLIPGSTAEPWPLVELRVPHADGPVCIDGSLLARGWRSTAAEMAPYTFYLPYTPGIRWNRRVQTRLAVHQWMHQMRQSRSPYGTGGLPALLAFADALEDSSAGMEETRHRATWDAGEAGHRDLLSNFFSMAAEVFDDWLLAETADRYEEIAALWRKLLAGSSPATTCAADVREIHAMECAALHQLESDFV